MFFRRLSAQLPQHQTRSPLSLPGTSTAATRTRLRPMSAAARSVTQVTSPMPGHVHSALSGVGVLVMPAAAHSASTWSKLKPAVRLAISSTACLNPSACSTSVSTEA